MSTIPQYITNDEYRDRYPTDPILEADLTELLQRASMTIDSMTFNRITVAGGLEYLTPFQRDRVRISTFYQANFYKIAPSVDVTSLTAGTIESVSILDFDIKLAGGSSSTQPTATIDAFALKGWSRDAYNVLIQTGLMCEVV